MAQTDLNRLTLFAAVAEAGSFTAAADRLGMAKSQVSQQIARLEKSLGHALFNRSTRRVTPTEAGTRLYADCQPALQALDAAVSQLDCGSGELNGRLRLTASVDYARSVLGPQLAAFARQHPKVELELIASDQVLDLVGEGIDLAIRGGFLKDSSLKATRLGNFRQVLVASPALFQSLGALDHPAALQGAPWVPLTVLRSPLTWTFTHADGRTANIQGKAVFRSNSVAVVQQMAKAGLGFAVLPDYLLKDDLTTGALLAPLADWTLPEASTWAVYPASRQAPAKVRALIDWLRVA